MDALAPAGRGIARAAPSRLRPGRGLRLALWLPSTPLFLLLAPLVLVGSPLALLTRAGRRIAPWRAAWAVGSLLLSLSGLRIEIDAPRVRLSIRLF